MPAVATSEQLERVRTDLHGVQLELTERLAVVETQLTEHRTQSKSQHDDLVRAVDGLRREVEGLRQDLSDQGRTPPPAPPPSLPPGAAPTLVPAPNEAGGSNSDPGAITISPKRVGPWLRVLAPILATIFGGAIVEACHELEGSRSAEPVEIEAQP